MCSFSFCCKIITFLTVLTLSACDVTLKIRQGEISGKSSKTFLVNKEYHAFRGIPFAEPPAGSSRFTAPVPHPGWDGIYEADEEKPACAQFNHNVKKGQPFGVYGSEDCLYLDVFTPSVDNIEKLPVVVFIYNQNFMNSYNNTKDYAPDFFIEEGVIVVTVAHRLSLFGFMSLEDDVLPGNTGFKDVLLALEWVRDNIEEFGGNANTITLLGARGGADMVDFLLHSPKAEGLFSGVILQGGSALRSMYLSNDSRDRTVNLAKLVEKKASSSQNILNGLSKVSASDLLSNELKVIPEEFGDQQRSTVPFGPNVEHEHPGAVITDFPENLPLRIDVPMMIGYNSREGIEASFQYLLEPTFLTYVEREFPVIFPVRTGFRFDMRNSKNDDAVNEIKNFYFANGKVKISRPSEYITYIGDVLVDYAVNKAVQSYANSSSESIYYFVFDYSGSLNENKVNILNLSKVQEGTWGAASGDELCYLFMCPDLKEAYAGLTDDGADEMDVSRRMVRMWSNFAKYRNPTPLGDKVLEGFTWEPATKDRTKYLQIRDELKMRINPNAGRMKFWDNFIDKYSKLAVDGIVGQVKDEL